jgi:predicted transcriptional regulator
MLSVMVGFAVDNKLIDREEIQKFFDDTNSYSSGHEITEEEMKTLSDFINNVMTKCEELISSNIGDTMAEEIYEYLKGEGK